MPLIAEVQPKVIRWIQPWTWQRFQKLRVDDVGAEGGTMTWTSQHEYRRSCSSRVSTYGLAYDIARVRTRALRRVLIASSTSVSRGRFQHHFELSRGYDLRAHVAFYREGNEARIRNVQITGSKHRMSWR